LTKVLDYDLGDSGLNKDYLAPSQAIVHVHTRTCMYGRTSTFVNYILDNEHENFVPEYIFVKYSLDNVDIHAVLPVQCICSLRILPL